MILLVACGGLAAIFATASRGPRAPVQVLVTSKFVAITIESCSPTPLGVNCATHAQAERLRAKFAKAGLSVPVSGNTVALLAPIPTPTLPPAGVP